MAKPDTAKKAVTPAEEAPPPQPKKSKKKLILLLALVVLLAAAGGGAYFFLMGEAPAKGESPAHAERHIMTLDPFLVNLADKDSRRYLKVKLDL